RRSCSRDVPAAESSAAVTAPANRDESGIRETVMPSGWGEPPTFHDFWLARRPVCPVCPTQTGDITGLGGAGGAGGPGGGGRGGEGAGAERSARGELVA